MSLIYSSIAGQIDTRIPVGQIDSSGYVYNSVAGQTDMRVPIGQVDSFGYVYDSIAGQIDMRIPIGQVDSSGYVYACTSGQIDLRVPVGQVKGSDHSDHLQGGAALLLLLKQKLPTSNSTPAKDKALITPSGEGEKEIEDPGCFGCWPVTIVLSMLAVGLIAIVLINLVEILTVLIIIGIAVAALVLIYSIVKGFVKSDNRSKLLNGTLKGLAIGASIGLGIILVVYSGFVIFPDQMNITIDETNKVVLVVPVILITGIGAIVGAVAGFFKTKN